MGQINGWYLAWKVFNPTGTEADFQVWVDKNFFLFLFGGLGVLVGSFIVYERVIVPAVAKSEGITENEARMAINASRRQIRRRLR